MGRFINLDERLSEEDKDYLRKRGRGYLIPANERRFGTEEEPIDADEASAAAVSPFYDTTEREKAVYDVGGAPLPGTTLDYNTGRVATRDDGVLVEYTGPGHTPGAHDLSARREPEGFTSTSDSGDDIDDDIVEHVLTLPNVAAIKEELAQHEVEIPSGAKRDDLENLLAVTLQDERDAEE